MDSLREHMEASWRRLEAVFSKPTPPLDPEELARRVADLTGNSFDSMLELVLRDREERKQRTDSSDDRPT